jgi:hypothetical protein
MKKLWNLALTLICLLNLNVMLFAQAGNGDAGAACGVMGCGIIVWLIMILVIFGIAIGIVVFIVKWIKKDATSRGMPNADSIKWLGLLGLLGLIIYLVQRPQGTVPPAPPNNQWGQ